jgi:hypothetical protein
MAAAGSDQRLTRISRVREQVLHVLPHLSTVTAPLARAASKRNLIWTPEMQHSFESTKQAFDKVQTLSVPGPNGEYVLETDASQTGIGACPFQVQDGLEKPVGYFSRSLKDA